MQITAINKDKKHLTKITFSNGEECFLDNDVVSENGLSITAQIDEEFLSELKFSSDFKRAKSRALWYLDRMDYTEKALYEKLVRAGFSKKASAAVIAKLCELALIDDRRYAERMADRLTANNISKREALNKMYLKGIPLDLAKEVLSQTESDEGAQIKALLEGKFAYKLTLENGVEKVFAALVRKGFSFSAVRSALKQYIEEL
ncbi:MAG: RecX family transcriptional regulator [Clostridia bacterium]|nr:RecX family transcriptional regulator [Clostridia bacterium]